MALTKLTNKTAIRVPLGIINDLSQTYIFDTVAAMKASLIVFPVGKILTTTGYYNIFDNAGATYVVITPAQAASEGVTVDEWGNHTLADSNISSIKILNDTIYVSRYGAIGNDVNDDTAAIQAATERLNQATTGAILLFDAKRYIYNGVWRPLTSGNDKQIIGMGSSTVGTQITFSYINGEPYSIRFAHAFSGLTMKGFKFKGQGIAVFNPNSQAQNGMTDQETASTSYGANMIDIQFSDWSGNGADMRRWFQQRWLSCYARDIGKDGFIISGDQAASWDMAGGAWFNNVIGYALWFKSGSPNIVNCNIGPCNNGIKLGNGTASPCRATMRNINFEWIKENGIGILVTANSQILDAGWLLFYGDWDEAAVSPNLKESYAQVVFERLVGRNVMYQIGTSFLPANDKSGGWSNRVIVESTNGGEADRLELDESIDSEVSFRGAPVPFVSGASRKSAVGVQSDRFLDRDVLLHGVDNKGVTSENPIFWTRSIDGGTINFNIFASGTLPTNSHYALTPDDGQIVINLPPPTNWIGKPITFTNATDGTNNFRLNTYGSTLVDGVNGLAYQEPYASVTIMAVDSNNWIELARKI